MSKVLDDSHLQLLRDALRAIEQAQREIDLAKRAGIDVSQHQERLNKALDQALAVKNTYFPGQ